MSRLGSLGSLAPLGGSGSRKGSDAFGFDEDERKATTTSSNRGAGGMSSLSGLAPIGGSSSSSSISRPTTSSGLGGLGSLTSLSKPPTATVGRTSSAFDMDEDGFDALLSSNNTSSAAAKKKEKDPPFIEKKPPKKVKSGNKKSSYDNDDDEDDASEDDYDDGGYNSKKKGKKSISKKDTSKDKRTLPPPAARKLPLPSPSHRPTTSPTSSTLDDDEDAMLFGIKKTEPAASATKTNPALARSQSEREPMEEKKRATTATTSSKPAASPSPSSATFMPGDDWDTPDESVAATPAKPTTTTSSFAPKHSPSSSSELTMPSSSPALKKTVSTPSPSPSSSTYLPEPTPIALVEEAPRVATFGSRRRGNSTAAPPQSEANPTPSPVPASFPPAASPVVTATPSPAPSPVTSSLPPFSLDTSSPKPLASAASTTTTAAAATSPATPSPQGARKASDDPFAGLLDSESNPMDEIDERASSMAAANSSSGRPTTASAMRTRRQISTAASTVPAASPTFGSQSKHVPAASPPSITNTTTTTSTFNATLSDWYTWLSINPRVDTAFVTLAQDALAAGTPKGWNYQKNDSTWIDPRGKKHTRHPYLGYYKGKLESKRLAIQFNVEEDEDEEDEKPVASGDEDAAGGSRTHTPSALGKSFGEDSHDGFGTAAIGKKNAPAPISTTSNAPSSNTLQPATNFNSTPSHSAAARTQANTSSQPPPSFDLSAANKPTPAAATATSTAAAAAQKSSSSTLSAMPNLSQLNIITSTNADLSALQHQLHLARITIEDLESRKRTLLAELDQASSNTTQALLEQRGRYEKEMNEAEVRWKAEVDAVKVESAKIASTYTVRIGELEHSLAMQESRLKSAVTSATLDLETKHKSLLEHTQNLASRTTETQRTHYEREIESLKILHSNELNSLKQQYTDSAFLRSLVTQVESSVSQVETLSKKVFTERTTTEKLSYEQLMKRDELLEEKAVQLEKERERNESLLLTFNKLQSELSEEKIRLRHEATRLSDLQSTQQQETTLLHDQLRLDRISLQKDKDDYQRQRQEWDVRYKKEMNDLNMKREQQEKQHLKTHSEAEDAQYELTEKLKVYQQEYDEMKNEKRLLLTRRIELDQRERVLQSDEMEFQSQVEYFEVRMNELQVMGMKVKKQSEDVAQAHAALAQERALIEAAKQEARDVVERGVSMKEESAKYEEKYQEEKKRYEAEKKRLAQLQKKVMLEEDRITRDIDKSITAYVSTPKSTTQQQQHAFLTPRSQTHAPVHQFSPHYDDASIDAPVSSRTFDHHSPISMLHFHPTPAPAAPLVYHPLTVSAALASLSSQSQHLKAFIEDEQIVE